MTETVTLPILPLIDDVVLPGMVAPITLDGEAQAAIDAARSAADGKLVLVPRVNGTYNADGSWPRSSRSDGWPTESQQRCCGVFIADGSGLVFRAPVRRYGYRCRWSRTRG
jgi:hypothetical protein